MTSPYRTPSAAVAACAKRYFTGKPCRDGHVSERWAASGVCCECEAGRPRLKFTALQQVKNKPTVTSPYRTRAEALAAGGTRYFTGDACLAGHIAERMSANGCCRACVAVKSVAWRERNPEEYKAKAAKAARLRREKNPGADPTRTLKAKLKREARQEFLAGRRRPAICEVCEESDESKRGHGMVFDHCHGRGHFRGWLCGRCNTVLGGVKDNIRTLHQLADYLARDAERLAGAPVQGFEYQRSIPAYEPSFMLGFGV